MDKVAAFKFTVCGAGAIGSNLIFNLAKQGFKTMVVADFDRVEEHNIGTQIYGPQDIGHRKVDALRSAVYVASGVDIVTFSRKVQDCSQHIWKTNLVVDALDNSESRAFVTEYCQRRSIPCLHAGFNGAYAEIKWNEIYRIPSNAGEDVCEYPLARNLVTLTCSLLAEAAVLFATENKRLNAEITFKDLRIHTF